jgi:hypothetical protein
MSNDPRDTSTNFQKIAEKIFDALQFTPLDQIFGTVPDGVLPGHVKVDAMLQEVIDTAEDHTIGELTMYLRSTYSSSPNLQNWQPLLAKAREVAAARQDPDAKDVFHGLDVPYKRYSF